MKDRVIVGHKDFPTLVAVTPREHQQGLMFKPWPPPVMSFPYDTAEIRKFWMKDTPSPLDIIFGKDDKVVGIYRGKPLSLECVGPDIPSDLVVELPQGTVDSCDIKIGSDLKLYCSLKTIAKQVDYRLGKII